VKSITANDEVQKASESLQGGELAEAALGCEGAGQLDGERAVDAGSDDRGVDSGIDASRSDFAGRVLGRVNLTSTAPTRPATATATARSSRASRRVRLRATPASHRARTSSTSTS